MVSKKIKEEPITIYDVKKSLENIEKKYGELNYRAKRTLEYAKAHTSLSESKVKDLKKKLEEAGIVRLKDKDVVKIIELLPKSKEEFRAFLPDTTLTDEDVEKIIGIVKEITG